MSRLSISQAWDETKAIVARDGKLLAAVALALIALPAAITGLVNPDGMTGNSSIWADVLTMIASVIAIAGQLALMRLAFGPSITVGGAIAHGFRRAGSYLVAAILILVGLMLLSLPFILIMALLGIPLSRNLQALPPSALLLSLLYFLVVIALGMRMVLTAPVASAEQVGPITIIKRSWELTAGHWWRLFGFVLIFFIGASVALVAVSSVTALIAKAVFGAVQPMTTGALLVSLVQALLNAAVSALFAVMLARIYMQLTGHVAHASVPSSGT